MKYRILLTDEAEKDLEEALIWYEQQRAGLGIEFLELLDSAFKRIAIHPYSSYRTIRSIYRYIPGRFPYGIYYVIDNKANTVTVISILHFKRNPKLIRKRPI